MSANTSNQDGKTTPKQGTFIQSLLTGNSIVASAKVVDVAEKTAHQWLKLPHVQKAYREAQHQVFDEALSHLMLDIGEARSTLKTIMTNEEAPYSVRVRAAQIILDCSIQINRMEELEARLEELEQTVKVTHV